MRGVLSVVPFPQSGVELKEGIKVLLNGWPYVVDRDFCIYPDIDGKPVRVACRRITDVLTTILIVSKDQTLLLDYSQWDEAIREKAIGREVEIVG